MVVRKKEARIKGDHSWQINRSHLLLIEDNPDDAKLTQDMLEKAANDKLEIVMADRL